MTVTVTITTDPDDSQFSQWSRVGTALRRVAIDAGYAAIYDTSAARLVSEPVTDFDGNVIATVVITE